MTWRKAHLPHVWTADLMHGTQQPVKLEAVVFPEQALRGRSAANASVRVGLPSIRDWGSRRQQHRRGFWIYWVIPKPELPCRCRGKEGYHNRRRDNT